MMSKWSPGQDVCLAYGVSYDVHFEGRYRSIAAGHEAGLAALRGER